MVVALLSRERIRIDKFCIRDSIIALDLNHVVQCAVEALCVERAQIIRLRKDQRFDGGDRRRMESDINYHSLPRDITSGKIQCEKRGTKFVQLFCAMIWCAVCLGESRWRAYFLAVLIRFHETHIFTGKENTYIDIYIARVFQPSRNMNCFVPFRNLIILEHFGSDLFIIPYDSYSACCQEHYINQLTSCLSPILCTLPFTNPFDIYFFNACNYRKTWKLLRIFN